LAEPPQSDAPIGVFEVNLQARELRKHGVRVRLRASHLQFGDVAGAGGRSDHARGDAQEAVVERIGRDVRRFRAQHEQRNQEIARGAE